MNYSQIEKMLPFVPLSRIKSVLGQSDEYVWNGPETYINLDFVDITDGEGEGIRDIVEAECAAKGYVSLATVDFGDIAYRYNELSEIGLQDAIFERLLSDRYTQQGRIVTKKGQTLNITAVVKEHCKALDRATLDGLMGFVYELTGQVSPWSALSPALQVMVRLDRNNFVSDDQVDFDVERVDEAIFRVLRGDYAPLRYFTTFAAFPHCGQAWNLYLLESYVRRFSQLFRFDAPAPGVNSKNVGAAINRTCNKSYVEIMADAVAGAGVALDTQSVGQFLYSDGYIGKSTNASVPEIISLAQSIRRGEVRGGTEVKASTIHIAKKDDDELPEKVQDYRGTGNVDEPPNVVNSDVIIAIKRYFRKLEKATIPEIISLGKAEFPRVPSEAIIRAAQYVMVRVDANTFLADEYVDFDIDGIDGAISLLLASDYWPIKAFAEFDSFPDCGHVWNRFLLESYCRRFSRAFRFDTVADTMKNVGVVANRKCTLFGLELLADAILRSNIGSDEHSIVEFLVTQGYLDANNENELKEIQNIAQTIKEAEEIGEQHFESILLPATDTEFQTQLPGRFKDAPETWPQEPVKVGTLEMLKDHCLMMDKVRLEDIVLWGRRNGLAVSIKIILDAVLEVMVRINSTTFVADKNVTFDIEAIDDTILKHLYEEYLPILSFKTDWFKEFSLCGQV